LSQQDQPDAVTAASPSLALIAQTWWPLAMSWLLMSIEGPAHSAVVARLPNAEVNLAAWGGIVFPLALIIESPVVMLLTASTALSRDWTSYRKLRTVAIVLGIIFTTLHTLVAFTPLYDIVARGIIGAPEAILEPGRTGLMIMMPWTMAIAYRRFQQGAMIRFGHTRAVGVGTAVRLCANGTVLVAGFLLGTVPGIVVASGAVAVGVIAEAIYAGLRVQPIVERQIRHAPRDTSPMTTRQFVSFYLPLALTSLISFFVSPLISATMSRMPSALDSLAAWPVVSGFLFVLRSPGMAYNEVVVALLDDDRAFRKLRRFATVLGTGLATVMGVIVLTPLSRLWFGNVMALPPNLRTIAGQALALALLLPPLTLLQSWYQGMIVNSKRTRAVTESVVVYLGVMVLVMGAGVLTQRFTGLLVATTALTIAALAQVAWLRQRSHPIVRALLASDN
jgi:hypothetical protein